MIIAIILLTIILLFVVYKLYFLEKHFSKVYNNTVSNYDMWDMTQNELDMFLLNLPATLEDLQFQIDELQSKFDLIEFEKQWYSKKGK